MTPLEIEYFDEYKKIDRICKDMDSSYIGLTSYIDRMYNMYEYGLRYVGTWEDDLKVLKRLRRVRNSIAHDDEQSICNERDLRDLKQFHDDLLSLSDPLAIINRELEARKKKRKSTNKSSPYIVVYLFIVILIVIFMLAMIGSI